MIPLNASKNIILEAIAGNRDGYRAAGREMASRAGVVAGLDQMNTPESIEMARLVEGRLKEK